jgi:hypothetical protein
MSTKTGRLAGWWAGACALLFVSICRCYNPFFPPMGDPVPAPVQRGTPAGVVKQLIQSYESRRIDLFRDLFDADGSFRFYVPQSSIQEMGLSHIHSTATLEIALTYPAFIDSGTPYEYIRFSDEVALHNNMFENAELISFTKDPTVDSVVYTDSLVRVDTLTYVECDSVLGKCDTVVVPDSVFDTLRVAMRTREAEVLVSSDILTPVFQQGSYTFTLPRQAFFLKRDPADRTLWVIDKWFELP